MQKFIRFIFSRRFIAVVLALFQFTLFSKLITDFYTVGPSIYLFMTVFSIAVMLYIFEKDNLNPSYKLVWVVVMVIFPVTGAVFYFLWGDTRLTKRQQRAMFDIRDTARKYTVKNKELMDRLESTDLCLGKQARYLENIADAPVYENTATKFYPMGAAFFIDFLEDLRNAKKTIFLQYFIIDEGYMWDSVLKILKEKAEQGVDVRVIYDGFGCLLTLPEDYEKLLRSYGIKAYIFNPVRFSIELGDYLMLNHRDHRKITVIDSNIGYGGGLNMADEYINVIERFGVWKDTAFHIEGDGVYGLSSTFLQNWQLLSKVPVDYSNFKPTVQAKSDGIVQPYFDTPLDKFNVCENTYLGVINNAKKYVYIATPYLIIDNELLTSLTLTAQSGVDVRIIVPGIPDKWYVYYITQSYYKVLIEAGVKIYEYTPGFLHAKMYVSDDTQAIVGSANMDYRSLYLHYENCCGFYGGSMVSEVKKDFIDTISRSRMVTMEDVNKVPFLKRLYQIVFRVLSPLM
ncbi:MAG: cardiolipin synthase [Oscillospiraceae bacterium]